MSCSREIYAFMLLFIFSTERLIIFIAFVDVPMLSPSCNTVHRHTKSALNEVNTVSKNNTANTPTDAATIVNAPVEAAHEGMSALRVCSMAFFIAFVSTFLSCPTARKSVLHCSITASSAIAFLRLSISSAALSATEHLCAHSERTAARRSAPPDVTVRQIR